MTGELVPLELLAPAEQTRLAELEQIVDAGLQTFGAVGRALLEIRDSRLYRQTYDTFEAYLDERWGMSRSNGYRLIDAGRVAELVSPIGDIANEAQARELVPLLERPDELVDVVRELRAEHGGRLTAEKVRAAVEERIRRENLTGALTSSDTFEWYTPPEYVEAAREVLGGIDLDPASTAAANSTVGASVYYDIARDGLAQPWHGRVFMNPPYGGHAGRFVAKLLAEHEAGRVTAAVSVLSGPSFATAWFEPLWDGVLCFTGRLKFTSPLRDSPDANAVGSVFVYLGPDRVRFAHVFSAFGTVVERIRLEEPAA